MIEIRGAGGGRFGSKSIHRRDLFQFSNFPHFPTLRIQIYIYIFMPRFHTRWPIILSVNSSSAISPFHSPTLSLSFSTVVIASPLRVFTDRYSSIYKSFYSRTVRQTTGNYRFQVDGSPAVFMRPLDPPAPSNNGRQNLVRLVISPARYARKITITRCVFSELPAFISKKKCPRHNNNKRRGGRRGRRPILAEGKKKKSIVLITSSLASIIA